MHQFTFPSTVQEGSLFSTLSPAFTICGFFDGGHSDQWEMIFHCSFDLYFSSNDWCQTSFHVFISHLYVFFGEMSVYVFCPLFDWVVCFPGVELMNCLYILEINPLSVVSFAVISLILRAVSSPCLKLPLLCKSF